MVNWSLIFMRCSVSSIPSQICYSRHNRKLDGSLCERVNPSGESVSSREAWIVHFRFMNEVAAAVFVTASAAFIVP